ncbi:ABC transporter ATP-binding protein [Ramlibacter sp.]|uniref:ABC transporter ATP-binding protein n=1 Tax=Ramlibacter sp. TaxID=1917967 RepID=UPI003D0ADB17
MTAPIVQVEHVAKRFKAPAASVRGGSRTVHAVDGLSFEIFPGRTLGVVGESGCGKSTTAKLLLKLEEPTEGAIRYRGEDLRSLSKEALRAYRRGVQAVFQDPFASLDPRMRVRSIVSEPITAHEKLSSAEVTERVAQLLEMVGLPARSQSMFPHEFSGGQRQRIAIARALALKPGLIVLDEPVSALDVSIRAQILNLLADLQSQLGVSYLFITHDLDAVAHMSHEILVMYLGRIVEKGDAGDIADNPLHPYTRSLFAAALPRHPDEPQQDTPILGEIPSPLSPPSGCHFHPRCPQAMEVCKSTYPAQRVVQGRSVACHLYPETSS